MFRSRRHAVGAALAASVALVVPASVASAETPTKVQATVTDDFSSGSIRFVVDGIPPVVPADNYKLELVNNSIGPHVLIGLGGLPADLTEAEFIELIDSGPPPPAGVFEAGAVFSAPGTRHQKQFDLTAPGRYGYFCPITTPAGTPHYQLGFVGLTDAVAQ
jgi:hypothetical protein